MRALRRRHSVDCGELSRTNALRLAASVRKMETDSCIVVSPRCRRSDATLTRAARKGREEHLRSGADALRIPHPDDRSVRRTSAFTAIALSPPVNGLSDAWSFAARETVPVPERALRVLPSPQPTNEHSASTKPTINAARPINTASN
jgi:hypothetical protein